MDIESKIDDKGRITIPSEIRKQMNIKSGEKFIFQVQDNKIILRKSISVEEFIQKSKKFSEKLREVPEEMMEFEKLFD